MPSLYKFFLGFVCASMTLVTNAQDFPCDEVDKKAIEEVSPDKIKRISGFQTATPVERANPRYPAEAARTGSEGWVTMSYVINEEGAVEDVIVDDYSGHKAFRHEAVRALKRWKFDPAMKNGAPTEQCHQAIRIDFLLEDNTGAKRSFIRAYREIEGLLSEEKFALADEKMAKLEAKRNFNRYESTYFYTLDGKLARRLNDVQRELNSYSKALNSANQSEFEDAFKADLIRQIFALEVNFGYYALALESFDKLLELDGAEAYRAELAPVVEEINALIESKSPMSIALAVKDSGSQFYTLTRNQFGFSYIDGDLDSVEVRCESHREKFTVAENFIWSIPQSWGQCRVLIQGEPGTTFELVEVNNA
ncbi:energy transducer TonB [Alteromonas antoniana]|uniref:energy transducer TonB n=1 Tax=Alteromonas antoniana TaxID=2803813 RepID=UPI001C44477E|nr:energy transducer TonB [Alteromonas antoniana]